MATNEIISLAIIIYFQTVTYDAVFTVSSYMYA